MVFVIVVGWVQPVWADDDQWGALFAMTNLQQPEVMAQPNLAQPPMLRTAPHRGNVYFELLGISTTSPPSAHVRASHTNMVVRPADSDYTWYEEDLPGKLVAQPLRC